MLKKVIYNNTHEAIFIDGKFSSLTVNHKLGLATSPYVKNVKDIYFMHNGVLYAAHNVHDAFFWTDIEMYQKGLMKKVLDYKNIGYSPWKELRTPLRAIRERGKRPERTNIQIHIHNAVLVDMPGHDVIEGQYYFDGNTYELLTYQRGSFTYGLCSEPLFDGYPDLNDSSTCMNLMLTGANVEQLKVLVDMFEEYTKHMQLPRRKYINVQLQA